MKMDLPEERLLRLIKGKQAKPDKHGAHVGPAGGRNSILAEFIKNIFMKNKIIKISFLPPVNRILIAALIILCGYLIYGLVFPAPKDVDFAVEEGGVSLPEADTASDREALLPEGPDYSVYSEEIGKKELFGPSFSGELKRQKGRDVDISKRFVLVGIIAGERPQAIIEDKETKKTHYLYNGQSFNGVTVEEIGRGKVVLNYGGEEIILVL